MPDGFKVADIYADFDIDVDGAIERAATRIKAQGSVLASAGKSAGTRAGQDLGDGVHDGFTKSAKKTESAASQNATRIQKRYQAIAYAAMFAGMPVAATAAVGATAAVLGGVPVLFTALGAVALKSNAEVATAWTGLGGRLKAESASWAAPLADPLVAAAGRIGATVDQLGPQIRQAFTNSAQGVGLLTDSVTGFATTAMPGLVTASRSGVTILSALPVVSRQVGTGFTNMAASLSSASGAVASELTIVGGVVQDLEEFIGEFAANVAANGEPALQLFRTALQQTEGVLTTLTQDGSAVYGFFSGFGTAVSGVLSVVQTASSVIAALPTPVAQFGGSLASTALLANRFGLNVGAAFDGVGGRIKAAWQSADTFKGKMAGVAGAVTPAVFNPTTAAVVGLSVAFDALGQVEQREAQIKATQTQKTNEYTAALQASNGVVDDSVRKITAQNLAQRGTAESAQSVYDGLAQMGVAQKTATDAVTGNDAALAQANATLDAYAATHSDAALAVSILKIALNGEASAFRSAAAAGAQATGALSSVSAASANAAAAVTQNVQALQQSLAVANAAGTIQKSLADADEQVASATMSVTNAQHALAQAGQGVVNAQYGVLQAQEAVTNAQHSAADAAHGVQTAQRSLAQAYYGVTQAEQAYTRAQDDARTAQLDLNKARQQAIQDLKDLHLQLADQAVSEGQAALGLFDAQKAAAAYGVDLGNAHEIASQKITEANAGQIRAALDLIAAQNQVNDSQNEGAKLREKVAAADAAGVEGSEAVTAAKRQLASAEDAVTDAARQLEQAHQAVSDAEYGLSQASWGLRQAQIAVRDAAWGQRQASLAVKDAQWQQYSASVGLTQAQLSLRNAQDQASRSFDINTEAGRRNLGQLAQLWQAVQNSGIPADQQYQAMLSLTAGAFGVSRDRAREYVDQLGRIDKDFRYSVTAVGGADVTQLKSVWRGAVAGVKSASGWNFAEGGYTGPGGKYEPAGIVHAGEVVWSQADVARSGGVAAVDSARRSGLPGYASGGVVAAQVGYGYSQMGTAYQAAVNTLQVMGAPHPPGLPRYEEPAATGFVGTVPGYRPSAGVAQWTSHIANVLGMLGLPGSFIPAVQRRMNQESGGNPTIVNKWDSNWKKGTPSVGLMQVIGPTFAANAGPFRNTGPFSYGVSVDPTANIYAGLNYAGRRYGPGHGGYAGGVLYAMNKPGGYDQGGLFLDDLALNSTGKPEMILPPDLTNTMLAINRAVQAPRGGDGAAMTTAAGIEARLDALISLLSGGVTASFDANTLERGLIAAGRRRAVR